MQASAPLAGLFALAAALLALGPWAHYDQEPFLNWNDEPPSRVAVNGYEGVGWVVAFAAGGAGALLLWRGFARADLVAAVLLVAALAYAAAMVITDFWWFNFTLAPRTFVRYGFGLYGALAALVLALGATVATRVARRSSAT